MSPKNKKNNTYLSKTLFIKGLQCHKHLYLEKYRPELRDEIPKKQEALFQSGKKVGLYAQKLFPNGTEVLYEGLTHSEQLKKTMEEIKKGTTTIYEAAFSYDDIFVKVDILHKGKVGWEIYEVKGSTEIKDVYKDDVAIQYYVLKGSGLPVLRVFLVHINNQYVRHGDIEVNKLFTVQDITETVIEKLDFVKDKIKKMREMLLGNMPDIDIGKHCSDPYRCDFQGFCWQHIPEDSIFSLRDKGVNKFELYRQGIIHLRDVPKETLPRIQKIQLEGFLEKKDVINRDKIKEFLASLWYPICFFDFETTFMTPLPMFDGTLPYQQVPFQFSLHYLENENAELKHYEYLSPANTDPRKDLIAKVLQWIPEDACVLVYNKSFEEGILNYLKEWFPEYKEQIENIINNIRDLMIPFKNKDIYCWQMEGFYSIKIVLPVLVPELSYEGMEVSDGGMASDAWLSMWEIQDKVEIEKIRKALLEYCRIDTFGMVKILEKLREIL